MNSAHLHLLLTHVPVLGTFFGLALLGFALLRRNVELTRAGLVTLVLAALVAIPTFATGEGVEHAVVHLPGVREAAIERHEDVAGVALAALEVTGALALGVLVLERLGKARPAFAAAPFAVGLVAAGLMAWTASLGGQIRHTEIVGDSGTAVTAEPRKSQKHHDDDD